MTILMPSTPNFTTSRFYLQTNSQKFVSPLTNTVQRVLLGGAKWVATYTLPAMKKSTAGPWQSFFLQCAGMVNSFNGFDPDRKTPQGQGGAVGNSPAVNGSNQTGGSLITDGWKASIVVLKAGDYFSVNGEMKMMTADTSSDGSGNATLTFMPALRSSPSDNMVITVNNPTCLMILSDDIQMAWDCDMNGIYQPKTFTAQEVFS